ncbi:MAG: alpha/beta hydrolase [Rhodospirillales bacterium]|nr:alpha/beta hydrolase [Rhodospirillales bacterium]
MLFPGFELRRIRVPEGELRLRIGGSGPPLLLVHGNPQTHLIWHAMAPALAARFTVVCPDLRGYGESFKPPASADHAPYSKRAMAADLVALMAGLGFPRFRLVGHDRGGRVAHRLALDHPGAVERLAVLDIIPTLEHFERADMAFGLGYYHWFWFAQPHPFPENLISAAPETWFHAHTNRSPRPSELFHPEALADYLAAARRPDTIVGMCEDYRAAAGIDLVHDRESRARGEKIGCDLLALWGARGKIGEWYDAPAIWRDYCAGTVTTGAVDAGHYLPEEAPEEVLRWFDRFF